MKKNLRWSSACSAALSLFLVAVTALSQSTSPQIGREVAISRHLQDGEEFHLSVPQLNAKFKTISVSIDIQPKAFLGLRAVVMVHGIIGELTDGNDRARLMVGQYDQARWVVAGGLQAGGRQAYDFRGVPRAVGIVGQRLPPTSPPFPRYRQRWPFLAA